ncbi:hypothetical protein [Alicyclobacillus mengziensis]|uniref:Uncharacterized protein n=1 Tax=Alicyclobacillus mengziensis TaxID=2931921 RepID=A0A9X7Z6V6_9BACL|nr:hypothetical protein [Alicyclobacillus mengziensis]QSO48349.1 hypothetical protein JZ786_05005 [Alicyclobacillus mengziensis]
MSVKVPLFYDTNCFQHLPRNLLEKIIDTYDNKILSTVIDELWKHFLYSKGHPEHARDIDLMFDSSGAVRNEFQIVDIGQSYKNYGRFNLEKQVIKFKRHPFICSTYYHLLPLAYNPSSVLDPYGHVYNYFLHQLNHNLAVSDEIMELERKLKDREIKLLRKVAESSRTLRSLDPVKLMKVHKKKLKLAQQGKVSLTDVQVVVTALLWSCFFGTGRTCILTADRDLVATASTLMLSIFEKFVLNQALESVIDLDDELTRKELRETGKLHREISFDKLRTAQRKFVTDIVHSSEKSFELTVLYYKNETGELIPDTHKIPRSLRDFILEFKGNVDCYSLSKDIEIKYPLSHRKYDPSISPEYLHFDVFPRRKSFYDGMMFGCESRCRYVRQERKDPSNISDFYIPGV